MATGYMFLGAAHHVSVLVILIILGSVGGAVVRPSLTTLITKAVGEREQGMVLGVSQSLGSLAQAIGPAAATWLIGREQLVLYGVFCSTFSVLGCLVALRPGQERPEPLPAQAPRNS
jgi:MFS family permease